MKYLKRILSFLVIILMYSAASAQSNDSLFYRNSFQLNVAGLGFERYGIAYELRMTPRHALMLQGGGSFPFISKEEEYGFGLHYKYFLKPVRAPRFLWVFQTAYRNTFLDANARYMNLDGIHDDHQFLYKAYFLGIDIGQTWVWNNGFLVSYWIGYGPPIRSEFTWKSTMPGDGNSWANNYKNASGLDFGLTLGYSFGGR
ncbi:MAG: hypothetical protein ACFHWX_06475 [Bacteroidota bacterium]